MLTLSLSDGDLASSSKNFSNPRLTREDQLALSRAKYFGLLRTALTDCETAIARLTDMSLDRNRDLFDINLD